MTGMSSFRVKVHGLNLRFNEPLFASCHSCETDSSWEVIAQTSKTDSDVSCKKMIRSSLNSEIVSGNYVKFCLTNFGGHRCQKRLYHPSEVAKTYGNSIPFILQKQ